MFERKLGTDGLSKRLNLHIAPHTLTPTCGRINVDSRMIIAIEGIDGSGKGTQSKMLVDALAREGKSVKFLQFPQYESTDFGKEVGRYLNGEFGPLDQVHPKFSAMLYALDRYQCRAQIESSIEKGDIVVCDRYVGSNLAHQSARATVEDRESIQEWISNLEYCVLGVPRPDIVIFLDMPAKTAQALVAKKEARSYTERAHDLHEESRDHLQDALIAFRDLASKHNWITIECLDKNGTVKSAPEIHSEIMNKLTPKL